MQAKKLDNVDIEINTLWSSKSNKYVYLNGKKFSNTYVTHE